MSDYDSPTQLQPSELEALHGATGDALTDAVRRIIDQRTHALVARVMRAEGEASELRAEVERLRRVFRARIGNPAAKCTRCYDSGYVSEDGMDWPCPDCVKEGGGDE